MGDMSGRRSSSQRSSVSGIQIKPRPYLAMKLMASGVIFSAAMARSPSFSRSSSSTRTTMRPWRISSTASSTVAKELEEGGAEEGGAGDGEDPGEDDAARNAPADGGESAGSADANDGAGDGVSGADGDAENGVGDEGEAAGGFRCEATKRAEFGDALAHGLDDAPAAGHGP